MPLFLHRKTTGRLARPFFSFRSICELLALCGVALTAVDRTIGLRDEGYTGGLATLSAHSLEHLALAVTVVAGSLASVTAIFAAGGLILETLLGVESLFTGGEDEFLAAVLANQSLVLVHGKNTPKY